VKEMSDQMRGIVFVVAALAILFAWQHFYKPPVPPPQPKGAPTAQTSGSATSQVPGATPGTTSPGTTSPGAIPVGKKGAAPASPATPAVEQASEEKTLVVESALYRVEFSNRGAVVRSWLLKKYSDDANPPRPLDLVNRDSAQQLGWPFSLLLSDAQQTAQADSALYKVTVDQGRMGTKPGAPPYTGNEFAAPAIITFHWSDGHLDVTKQLSFGTNYEVTVNAQATLDGRPLPVAIAWRGGFGDKAVYKAATLVNVFYQQNDKLNLLQGKKLGVSGNQSQPSLQAGPLQYAGIEDQFFTAAFLADGTNLSLWHWTQDHSIVDDGKPATEAIAEMAAGTASPEPLEMRVFVGPKDIAILNALKPPLEELVQFGWTGIVAKPLLLVLQWLHKYIPNFGWAIVALTLLINIAMFPLKMKSWRSMQKMQKVGPEIRSIQDRYKKYSMNDPRKRKMNEEVMAIYKREGINPMGSCLPMVFQMPIWWALWRVLNGAIELRHAPWIGWIHDLSAMDPYYILPIAMTITMYLMTKMTPQTTVDPAQQKMFALMPVMMGFIFFRLSSGLNLYMFTSNLVGVAQQLYLNRSNPLPAKGKPKKKNE
jgi:YidC/Oxa1 family membrane protein insertase